MMKLFRTLLVVVILLQPVVAGIKPSFSENTSFGRIRESSLRRNEGICNKMAIDLVNGKSRQISIDRMISLLKKYDVVGFVSNDMDPAKDIILREVAFRMLKHHYLPRAGDKIRVYMYSKEISKEAGMHPAGNSMLQPELKIAINAVTIKESRKMNTLYWADIVSQISSAIEMLWVNRINGSGPVSFDSSNHVSLFKVLGVLKSRYLLEKPVNKPGLYKRSAVKIVVEAADEVLNRWLSRGIISDEEIPVSALLIKQYILLNISSDPVAIARQIKGLDDVNILYNALVERIDTITQCIKINNPSDYAVFAMFHSLLSEISDHILSLSENSAISSSQLRTKLEKPHYSA
jgi:hypothetical protein